MLPRNTRGTLKNTRKTMKLVKSVHDVHARHKYSECFPNSLTLCEFFSKSLVYVASLGRLIRSKLSLKAREVIS